MKIDSSLALNAYGARNDKKLEDIESKNDAKLKEQTDAFESILLKFMLDTSLKMDNPLYPKQAGSEIYESMYKDSLANQLSGSFGYSKLLFDWLKEQQK